MFSIERYNIVKEIKGIFNKGYLTGSYELGCNSYNDIDILIMIDNLPNIDYANKYEEKSQYSDSLFKNSYDFKFNYKGVVVNVIVFDNEEAMFNVVRTTNILKEYVQQYDVDIENKRVRVALFEYILRQNLKHS